MKRFIIVVLDSVGCGALGDAFKYNSEGANTLGHIAASRPLNIPNMHSMGLGNILPLCHLPALAQPKAAYGCMAARSAGMDTTTGHWEIAGLILDKPLPTFPQGFPEDLIQEFSARIGSLVLGNCVASGTQIIKDLGEEHMRTGYPIVYTSADSVFQIAAHESIIPIERLYEICEIAREILQGDYGVGRVIARPFVGNSKDDFSRTENRRDFSLHPAPGGLLEQVESVGLPVVSIGKINDIFAGCNISHRMEGHNNQQSMDSLYQALETIDQGLIFANFVDFDMLYGHRNDVEGDAAALDSFDAGLAKVFNLLQADDILAICADHGNDPTTVKTDHDREYVPLLVYGDAIHPVDLGIRASFADLGQTAAEYLGAKPIPYGTSFLGQILKK